MKTPTHTPAQTPAFYRRVSTDDQDNSIDAQEAYTLEYARFKRSGSETSSSSINMRRIACHWPDWKNSPA